jgi:hypothetical protein
MAAAAAATAAALGLGGDKEDVESVADPEDPADLGDPAGWEADLDFNEEEDDPPLDNEAIKRLKAEFRRSLVRVFGYSELSAEVIQDRLGLKEPVDLLQTWDSDAVLESACNNLIRGSNSYTVDDEVPVFRLSMLQDLILCRE